GLGGIFYFLLTGRPPFQGRSTTEVLAQVVMQPPRPPREHNADVPEGLEVICLKCLEKDPHQRYPSAAALAAALREWVAVTGRGCPPAHRTGAPPSPPASGEADPLGTLNPSVPQKAPAAPAGVSKWSGGPRRRRWGILVAVGFLVLAVGVGTLWLWRPR